MAKLGTYAGQVSEDRRSLEKIEKLMKVKNYDSLL